MLFLVAEAIFGNKKLEKFDFAVKVFIFLNGILLLYFAVVLLCDKLLLGLRIEMT
jgi:mannitol-specific phosphotransferase system IIBC component